ncbi:uncharacterized protein F4822DRAFT_319907 [Hypoxylon trugodes]|uniref:uncharacterized protein n=1 Tax=Hypoxylon trugodes TaxID=326681 RepID=UPI0021974E85|nr:uncharacterized protein F4822DRAFT_319907 [Hypoxylon trugodes]KAI1386553.1 hypothetical protein F4822DRAFT_319907 [Hypoxylon trugodes]
MSSTAAATATPPTGSAPQDEKKRKGVGKVLYRVKTVFKRGGRPKKGAEAEESTAPTAVVSEPTAAPAASPKPKIRPELENATKIPRIQIHEERAKKLGARFGLEIKPSEWHSSEGDVYRVEKDVRMRIHRECHRCHSAFGAGNECPNCQHRRCKRCTRTPPKRTEEERQALREKRAIQVQKNQFNAPIIPSYDYSEKIILKKPRKTGQDLVYKGKPRMRIRRHCHVCETLITSNAREARVCDNCGHRRCGDCPREPSDKKKYPYGYPNDEPGVVFKGVYACHECKRKFPPNTEDGAECRVCSHKKCPDCPRVKPKKVDPEPDPEIMEALRLRLAALKTADT